MDVRWGYFAPLFYLTRTFVLQIDQYKHTAGWVHRSTPVRCEFAYLHAWLRACVCVCVYVCIRIRVYVWVHVCMFVSACVLIRSLHVCMHARHVS